MSRPASNLLYGFIAGFIAVLLFHQPVLAVLNYIGYVKAGTYSMTATAPFGVPQILSIAFWGGVWGMLLATVEPRFRRGSAYWAYAFLFGAVFPTLVAWFVVAPLKGVAPAGGWDVHRMITGFVINGAWGIGTALLLTLMRRKARRWPSAEGLTRL